MLPAQDKHRRSNGNTPAGSYERPNSLGKHVNGFDKRKTRGGGGSSNSSWDGKPAPAGRPSHGVAAPEGHGAASGPAAAAQAPDPHGAAPAAAKGVGHANDAAVAEAAAVSEAAAVNGMA